MSKIRQAIFYSFASKYAIRLIGFVSIMLTARLLTPVEIGTFGIASAIVMVISEFRLLGAGSYLVREKEIPTEKIRSALGLTVLISWTSGAAIFASAPWVADFYELPAVEHIFQLLAIPFLLGPYIGIPTALLQRSLEFKALFRISLISVFVGFVSTIGLIMAGFSFYSLALGQLLKACVEFLLITYYRPKEMTWMPLFSGLGNIARFSIFTSVVGLIRRAHVTVPDMVIGKVGTPADVAMYSRGLGFINFVSDTLMSSTNRVALPYLSETRRSGGNITEAYTKASILIGGVLCPVLAVAGVASVPTIRLFFGLQWDAAAPIASWLALWGIFSCMHGLSITLLIAQGCEKILLVKEVFVFVIFVAAIIASYPFGLEAIAIAFVAIAVLDTLVSALVLRQTIALNIFAFFQAWIGTFAISVVCALVALLIGQVVDFNTPHYWIPILVLASIMPAVWVISLKLFRHPLFGEIERLWLKRKKTNTGMK